MRDRTERLLNLLFCLMAAERPLPREAIRQAVTDYGASPSQSAFERMFERDKDELRSMGIPVETVVNPAGEVEGYRVPRRDYELPSMEFTASEMSVLALAGRMWDSASMQAVAGVALRKLEAYASGLSEMPDPRVGVAPVLTSADAPWPELLSAVRERTTIEFDYRKRGETRAQVRRLEPWGVVNYQGAWYAVGRDTHRDSERVFRLSRFAGPPRAVAGPGSYDRPDGLDVRSRVGTWVGLPAQESARLRIEEGRAVSLRRRGTVTESSDGRDTVVIPVRDEKALASQIASYAGTVIVLDPPWLRDDVDAVLRGALDVHVEAAT